MGYNCVLFLFLSVPAVLSALTSVFSASDAQRLVGLIKDQQQPDGAGWGSLSTTHAAVNSLDLLGSSYDKAKLCSNYKNPLKGDLKSIYHSVALVAKLGCNPDKKLDLTSVQSTLQDAISGEAIVLLDTFYATQIIIIAGAMGDYDFTSTAGLIGDLMDDDGAFRDGTDAGDDEFSAVNAGLATTVLSAVYSSIPELQEEMGEVMRKVADDVSNLLELGGHALDFTAGTDLSSVRAASIILDGFQSLSDALSEQLDIGKDALERFGALFLGGKYVRNIDDGAALLAGLHVCASNTISVPLALIVTDYDTLAVRVTDVLDNVVPVDVSLEKLVSADDDDALTGLAFKNNGDGTYAPETAAAVTKAFEAMAPGVAHLVFKISPQADDAEEYAVQAGIARLTKKFAKISAAEFHVWTSNSAKSKDDPKILSTKYPAALSEALQVGADKYFFAKIQFESGAIQPSQVFLQFSKGNKAASFIAKATADGFHSIRLTVEDDEFYKEIYGAGDYAVSLIVGDSVLEKSFIWNVGTFKVAAAAAEEVVEDTAAPANLPDIVHQFRPEESRPYPVLPLIATGGIGFFGFSLVTTLLASGFSLNLPKSGTEYMSAMVFQGSIVAFLLLYALYWLHLSIFHALCGVCLLTIVAVYSGHTTFKLMHKRGGLTGKPVKEKKL